MAADDDEDDRGAEVSDENDETPPPVPPPLPPRPPDSVIVPELVSPWPEPLEAWRPPPPIRPARSGPGFFAVRGATILYCLSAACILYGLAQLITPVLATTEHLGRTLPCLGALHVYELAVLGVLALIVVKHNVNDDAVFLVVLVGLFLAASGLVLASIANDKPVVATAVGVFSLAIAAWKLRVLQGSAGVPVDRWHFAGLMALLGWNFLMAPAAALVRRFVLHADALMRDVWLVSWLVLLAGGVVVLLQATHTPSGDARRRSPATPLLRSPAMAWTVVLVLFFGATVQQYALTYVFDVPYRFGDFVPLIALVAVLVIELMRAYGKRFGVAELVLALVPLVAALIAAVSGEFAARPRLGIDLVFYPPVVLGLTALALAWLALRNGWPEFLVVVGTGVLAVILIVGVTPGTTRVLNWPAFGGALALTLFVSGVVWRRAAVAIAAVLVVCFGVALSPTVQRFAEFRSVPMAVFIGLAAGLGVMGVYAALPKLLSRWFAACGAVILVLSVVGCFSGASELDYPIAGGLAVAVVGGAVWLRTRDLLVATVCTLPLLRAFYVCTRAIKGWRYIVLAFALLALGALASLRKGRGGVRAEGRGDSGPA